MARTEPKKVSISFSNYINALDGDYNEANLSSLGPFIHKGKITFEILPEEFDNEQWIELYATTYHD